MAMETLRRGISIAPNLCAGVRIGGIWVTVGYSRRAGEDGRTRYEWAILLPEGDVTDDDLQSGCGGGNLSEGLESLLSFLSACAESMNYRSADGTAGEHADLFPSAVAQWAAANADELSTAAYEIEENGKDDE